MPNKTELAEWLLCRAGHDWLPYKEFIQKRNALTEKFTKHQLMSRAHTHTRTELNARYWNALKEKNTLSIYDFYVTMSGCIAHPTEWIVPDIIIWKEYGMLKLWATYDDRFEELMGAILDNHEREKNILRRFIEKIERRCEDKIWRHWVLNKTQRDLNKMLQWEDENKL